MIMAIPLTPRTHSRLIDSPSPHLQRNARLCVPRPHSSMAYRSRRFARAQLAPHIAETLSDVLPIDARTIRHPAYAVSQHSIPDSAAG
jgi:hypothetical protein